MIAMRKTTMSARERFKATMTFGEPDRVFYMPHWFWSTTIERWHTEGLPRDVHIDDYFGFDRYQVVPINLGLLPPFEPEIYYEDDEYRIYRRGDGQIVKEFKRRPEGSMPQWLDYALKSEEDWERQFKPRLNPNSPARYPLWWDDYVRSVRDRDYPLGIHLGSYYGWLRNWMGVENLSYMMYDNPQLVEEMCNYLADFVIKTVERALEEVRPDFALMWEDMAMKSGPLCSPEHFRRFMLPCYKKVTSFARSYGVEIVLLDSDGHVDPLIPLWLEGGVTGVYPFERAAGEDIVALRKQYGKKLVIIGGVDKRVLARSEEEIKHHLLDELQLPWMLSEGGYVPFVDHAVPPDVPLKNFQFYWDMVRKIAEGEVA